MWQLPRVASRGACFSDQPRGRRPLGVARAGFFPLGEIFPALDLSRPAPEQLRGPGRGNWSITNSWNFELEVVPVIDCSKTSGLARAQLSERNMDANYIIEPGDLGRSRLLRMSLQPRPMGMRIANRINSIRPPPSCAAFPHRSTASPLRRLH